MIKNIKTKIFLIFSAFMVILVLSGILLNALFLERYYIYKSKSSFVEISKKISAEYNSNKKNVVSMINDIDRIEGISCTITDKNLNVEYNSVPEKTSSDSARLPGEIQSLAEKSLKGKEIYTVVEKSDQAPKLVYITTMNNGRIIILKKAMKGISESVSIANQFYIFAGLAMALIGGILIFIYSGKITKPIIEMSNVAEGIANLDFTKRVDINTKDEIGSLAASINRISEKLSASIDSLKMDVDRRKQLVRNISHELKTPIGVIKGYAEGLNYGVADDREKIQRYCNVISLECDRMDGMVKELLNLSMLESGVFKLNLSNFNLGELIKSVTERFKPVFDKKDITFELTCDGILPVYADCDLIERVLNNYIINAVNHADGQKRIKVTGQIRNKNIYVSVFNTGSFIPESEIENIWGVFYKVDKARTRQYGGHGIGLSIVKQIIELHGGSVGVNNTDNGVMFYAEIPQNLENK